MEFIANAVSVLIVDAIAVAIKIRLRIVAIPRIGRQCIVIAGRLVLATRHLVLIADTITVGIEQARSIARITGVCVCAGVVFISRKRLKIAGEFIGASAYLVFIADAIVIAVVNAFTRTCVVRFWVGAHSSIRGIWVVIARLLILATKYLILIAYAVAVVIEQTIARTIGPEGRPIAGTVVIRRQGVVVAG